MREIGVGSIPWDLVESYVAQEDGAVAGIREEGGAVGQYRVVEPVSIPFGGGPMRPLPGMPGFQPTAPGAQLPPEQIKYNFKFKIVKNRRVVIYESGVEQLTQNQAVIRRHTLFSQYGQCVSMPGIAIVPGQIIDQPTVLYCGLLPENYTEIVTFLLFGLGKNWQPVLWNKDNGKWVEYPKL